MKINPEKLKKIGAGSEKRVYENPNNPDQAIGIFHEYITESSEKIKARFYLTKISHLLFPQNIPDIHLAASDPHAIVVDRIKDKDMSGRNYGKFYAAIDEFNLKLKSVGINWIDNYYKNFIFDEQDRLFYVDSFDPWVIIGETNKNKSEPSFDKEKLESALQNLEDEKRELGLSYLKRLEDLERIASSFEGVEKSYAVQAGRELRVFVVPTRIDDLGAIKLARDIAKKIEGEMKYPGEIKVNVIRETRAIEYAR